MMKTLQDFKETTWNFDVSFKLTGIIREPDDPKSLILLLHGLNERGRRIFRKLVRYLPQDSLVLAPNAPFPLSNGLAGGNGYAWYFYDKESQTYPVGPEISLNLIKNLLDHYNPNNNLPVCIIGFSQGGYLAPLVGLKNFNVKSIIGIGCEFRRRFITQPPLFELYGLHGENDLVIPKEKALEEIKYLKDLGARTKFSICPGAHEITSEMGELIQNYLESEWKK